MEHIRKMLITVLGMLLLLIPLNAAAATDEASDLFGPLDSQGRYVLESGTYTLTDDLVTKGRIFIPKGVEATVDLAGHTIDRGLKDKNFVDGGSVFGVDFGAKLTVKNGTGIHVADATNCFVADNDQNTETICESGRLFFVYPFTF